MLTQRPRIAADNGRRDGELTTIGPAESDVDRIARAKLAAAIDNIGGYDHCWLFAQRPAYAIAQDNRAAGKGCNRFFGHHASFYDCPIRTALKRRG